ncbi:hypothetical protein GCU68_17195 (plasmid) [Natronorubrum aibiense]|uniref:Uncharacterized protein n=1 Tax=Natronorubrum aibiense TaxID=348826 RepID=A0A5P9P8J7_9EURY|nr:hypothetical protein GCU68_17195 [Natronorubrum aibiense]
MNDENSHVKTTSEHGLDSNFDSLGSRNHFVLERDDFNARAASGIAETLSTRAMTFEVATEVVVDTD